MTALWGARNAGQLDAVEEAFGWKLSNDDYAEVDRILREAIKSPVGPEFMAPPAREPASAEACIEDLDRTRTALSRG